MTLEICLLIVALGVMATVWFYLWLKYGYLPNKKLEHEKQLKEKSFTDEQSWRDKEKVAKDEELERRIREYKELTIPQKLLDRVIDKKTSEENNDLKKELETLKKSYDSLNGEIEQIIIKKKQ